MQVFDLILLKKLNVLFLALLFFSINFKFGKLIFNYLSKLRYYKITNVFSNLFYNFLGRHFNYFGSSNSQLRDNGCYFINATVKDIENFRIQLGSFKIQTAPKMMSRIGQCFTQARVICIFKNKI